MDRQLEPEVMDDPAEARAYAAMDHSGPNAAFVDRLEALGARGRMLDVGTGPGHIPVLACQRMAGATVTAIDLAQSMLALAAERVREAQLASRIEVRHHDAKRLDFDDSAFDTVFSNTVLHHIAEPAPFLEEVARVLAPGGALFIRDLYRPRDPETVAALVAQHAADETAEQRELFRASLCAALDPRELRAAADAAGLGHAEITIDTDRHMSLQATWGCR